MDDIREPAEQESKCQCRLCYNTRHDDTDTPEPLPKWNWQRTAEEVGQSASAEL